jgi:hypothetical protein
VDRLVIVVPLRSGASAEAEKLIENGPPFDPSELGFERHGVYLSPEEVAPPPTAASATLLAWELLQPTMRLRSPKMLQNISAIERPRNRQTRIRAMATIAYVAERFTLCPGRCTSLTR